MSHKNYPLKWVLAGIMVCLFAAVAGGRLEDEVFSGRASEAPKEISWEKDIRPLLEKLVCVSAEIYFDKDCCGFHFKKECKNTPQAQAEKEEEAVYTSIQEKLVEAFLKKSAMIASLSCHLLPGQGKLSAYYGGSGDWWWVPFGFFYSGWEPLGKKFQPEDVPSIKNAYCQLLFSNQLILRILMPDIHSALKDEGLVCRDCPGPETKPLNKEFSFRDLMPFLVAKYRPNSINKDGSVTFEMIDLASFYSNDPNVDPDLLIATELLTALNFRVDDRVMEILQECMRKNRNEINKKAALGQAQKIDFIREILAKALVLSKEFKNSVLRGKIVLSLAGLKCLDCE